MMTIGGPEARIRYLSLALFAQKVLDVLVEFAEHGKEEGLDDCVREALQGLQVATGVTAGWPQPRQVRALSNYEQVRTLDEVSSQREVREIMETLQRLLNRQGAQDQAEQRAHANRAIDFFSQLGRHALRNFDQPDESLPRGIRELCKMT